MQEKIILIDSPEAAEYRTDISGWVASDRTYFGEDERSARYHGCTHQKCKTEGCPNIVEKQYSICPDCREKRDIEKWRNLPGKDWNAQEFPIYSDAFDEYFFDEDELLYIMQENDLFFEVENLDELRLMDCQPVYARALSLDTIFDLPGGCDEIPAALEIVQEQINELILEYTDPLYYRPGKHRLIVDKEFEREILADLKEQ